MKVRILLIAAAIVLLSLGAEAATLVVPAAGTGPGLKESHWQSELTLHTSGPRAVTLTLTYHQGQNAIGPVEVTLQPRETLSIEDIVKTRFGVASGTGAIVIDMDDRDAKAVAVTSRTFNLSETGEFGQDIPAIDVGDAAHPGDIAALTAPSSAATTRFNFGAYAIDPTTITWEVLRADGTTAATREETLAAGEHVQHNAGIQFIGADPADNDTVEARVTAGKAILYGSAINNATGDPTFVPSIRTRDDIRINFLGVDLDENGTVDVADADGDGVLDTPIEIVTSLFPAYFVVMAEGEFGEPVTLEIVSSPSTALLLDSKGTLEVVAGGDVKGTTGQILLRATNAYSTSILTIPVRFR